MLLQFRISGNSVLKTENNNGQIVVSFEDGTAPKAIDLTKPECYPDGFFIIEINPNTLHDIPSGNKLYMDAYIDINKLSSYYSSIIECVFLWYSREQVQLLLEYKYSNLYSGHTIWGIKGEIFKQLYPTKNTPLFNRIDEKRNDRCSWEELWKIIPSPEDDTYVEKNDSNEEPQSINNTDIEESITNKCVWEVFSESDLNEVIAKFKKLKDAQRSSNKEKLLNSIKPVVKNKINENYQVLFWKSGSGSGNMIIDDGISRNTILIGIVNNKTGFAIAFCLEKTNSHDAVWKSDNWYELKYEGDDITSEIIFSFDSDLE